MQGVIWARADPAPEPVRGLRGFGRRLAAYLIDRACAGLVAACLAAYLFLPLAGLDPESAAFEEAAGRACRAALGVWGLVHAAYFWLFTGLCGQTPGKFLLGLAVAGPDGSRPDLVRALVRELAGRPLAALPLGLGYFWALRSGRGWHDLLAGTRVVRVGLQGM